MTIYWKGIKECPIGLECIRDDEGECFNEGSCEYWSEPVSLPYYRPFWQNSGDRLIVDFNRNAHHKTDNGLKIYAYADLPPEWAVAWGCLQWEYPFSKIERLHDGCLMRRVVFSHRYSIELWAVGFYEPHRLPYSYDLEKRSLMIHYNLPEYGFMQAVDSDPMVVDIPW